MIAPIYMNEYRGNREALTRAFGLREGPEHGIVCSSIVTSYRISTYERQPLSGINTLLPLLLPPPPPLPNPGYHMLSPVLPNTCLPIA